MDRPRSISFFFDREVKVLQSVVIKTKIASTPMTWHIDYVGLNESGNIVLGGITRGSEAFG
jgi:hypothetical protein